jgi:hypothetical protein
MTFPALDCELRADPSDPIGLDGIEFVEYTKPRPQALCPRRCHLRLQDSRPDPRVRTPGTRVLGS